MLGEYIYIVVSHAILLYSSHHKCSVIYIHCLVVSLFINYWVIIIINFVKFYANITTYKNRGSAQLVHYQRMHVVSKVSKRFPTYTTYIIIIYIISFWEISWTLWKLHAFSGSVQIVYSLYSCGAHARSKSSAC